MESFIEEVEQLADKGYKYTRAELIGIFDPNRRHDEPVEIAHDKALEEIKAKHRFRSFAPERSDNFVKWHIDGNDYMWALSELLDRAKEVIFIQDWWLTPELYLRRPPAYYPEWRLDRILKRKAEEGVKVYVIVYKEVPQTMSMDSHYTKKALEALHYNIACMRHPDHIGTEDPVEFWSHHEKVVVIDNHIACIGGLDLCFGRWDTHTHPLADVHPTNFSKTLFPGQDYNNARIMDFHDVFKFANNEMSILESARMPWHDVHMTLTGPVVLDIVQHFKERWNEIKTRKYKDDARFAWITFPPQVKTDPTAVNEEAETHASYHDLWHEIDKYMHRFHLGLGEKDEAQSERPNPWTCRVQVVRSVSDWSHGVLTEQSIQNAYCQMIQEANHFIYIENQFFISSTKLGGQVKNQIGAALVQRILRAARSREKFKVIVLIPELPAFAGDFKKESSLKTIMGAQYRTINRGGSSIYEEIHKAGYNPMDYIRFYNLRAYDRINAPPSFISKIEEKSGVKFNQARVALTRQWIGDVPGQVDVKEVVVKELGATTEGIVVSNKTPAKTETIAVPRSVEEANETLMKFERAAVDDGDDDVSDTVSQQLLLRDKTKSLADEKWLGTEEEELNAYISELLYIHTKLMIVDDARVIMGSANLNDRSQRGDRDSEIALVVEDNDLIHTSMDGRPYMATRFAATLRRKLFKEHLGLIPPQTCATGNEPVTSFMKPVPCPNEDEMGTALDEAVADPLSDKTLGLWNETAKKNREIFSEIFRTVPTNEVRDWDAYEKYVPKVKPGHVAPGITLARLEARLSEVRGGLVEFPLEFLIDEAGLVEGPAWVGLDPTLPIYI